MFYQLTCCSEAMSDISLEDIRELVDTSRKNNQQKNITGCLVYRSGYFVQLIEGYKTDVKELFHNIEDDIRHENVEVLNESPCQERFFSEWTMGFTDLSQEQNVEKSKFNIEELNTLTSPNPSKVFTTKVFWYNVKQLLENTGFYIEKVQHNSLN